MTQTLFELLQKLEWRITWQGYVSCRVFLCEDCFGQFKPYINSDDQFAVQWKAGGGGPRYTIHGGYKGLDVPGDSVCTCCKSGIGMGEEISLMISVSD